MCQNLSKIKLPQIYAYPLLGVCLVVDVSLNLVCSPSCNHIKSLAYRAMALSYGSQYDMVQYADSLQITTIEI
jgi:hypothetical protein